MKWATKTGPHDDPTACARLINRSIDPEADFVCVWDLDEVPADATPFDMREVELSARSARSRRCCAATSWMTG